MTKLQDAEALKKVFSTRQKLNQGVRDFFQGRNYLEVETPSLAKHLIPESTIHPFTTTYYNEFAGGGERYLIPSPEVHLKELIAKGVGNVYEIARSFRNYEQLGKHHNPEFTMLEWYTMGVTYKESATIMEELWRYLFQKIAPNNPLGKTPWISTSVEELCRTYGDFELSAALRIPEIREVAKKHNITIDSEDNWESLFHKIFLTKVEPHFPKETPLILYDYPSQLPCLAKRKAGTPYRERWELFVGSLEIANCYTEEDNQKEVSRLLDEEYALRLSDQYAPVVDRDMEYHTIFEQFPPCSGVALGMDRILMLLMGASDISEVLPFGWSDSSHS